MTITYTGDVANASTFGCFNKILFRWKGSVYKLVYKELLAYIFAYLMINLVYREVLVRRSEEEDPGLWAESRQTFESVRHYCYKELSSIPMTFVLGFYVSLIVNRWWNQYSLLPWPDSMAMYASAFIVGKEERVRLMKRNIIRYVMLSYCMVLRTVSFVVKKRFPDLQHLVDAGLLREDELKVILSLDGKVPANKWFLPLAWASDICARALAEKKTRPQTVNPILGELVNIRNKLTGIINHDWVSVPLVYTQVVTLAIYSYFAAALIGYQWVHPRKDHPDELAQDGGSGRIEIKLDLFYPFFLTIQFVFFFGWLKVAETLINPFGEDDDDFEINRLIDRHIQVAYLIVDHNDEPELLKDKFWDETIPTELVYTTGAEKFKNTEFEGSAERSLKIKDCDKEYGKVHFKGQPGLILSRMPSRLRKDEMEQERNDIYEPVYFGHYESLAGSPAGSKRFTWLMGDQDLMQSIQSLDNAVYLSKKPRTKSRKKKIGKFDSFGSLLSMGSHSNSSLRNSGTGRKSPLYEKMFRKLGSFDGLVHKHGSGRSRSNSQGASWESHAKKHNGARSMSISHTGMLQPRIDEPSKVDKVPKRNFIINTHVELNNNISYDEDEMLETITEDPNSPYVTQTSLTQYCDQLVKLPTTPAKASLMEVFHEHEICQEMNKIHGRDSEGDREVGSFERGHQECSTSKEQHIAYSKIRFQSANSRIREEDIENSARREEHQIDYTDIKIGTVYV